MVSDNFVKDSIIRKPLYLQNVEILMVLHWKNYAKNINVFFEVIQWFLVVNVVFIFIIPLLCVWDNFLSINLYWVWLLYMEGLV